MLQFISEYNVYQIVDILRNKYIQLIISLINKYIFL